MGAVNAILIRLLSALLGAAFVLQPSFSVAGEVCECGEDKDGCLPCDECKCGTEKDGSCSDCCALALENIFLWSGHNYALEPIARIGLADRGGVLRIGLAHYNTAEEVDSLLAQLQRILA